MAMGEYVIVKPAAGGWTWIKRNRKGEVTEEGATFPGRDEAVAVAKDLNPELVVMDTRENLL